MDEDLYNKKGVTWRFVLDFQESGCTKRSSDTKQ